MSDARPPVSLAAMVSPTRLLLTVLLALMPLACTSSDRAARDSFDLAQFEERQGNMDHARQLYQEILSRYPRSEWAQKAKGRLEALPSK